jgi:biotin synthase
MNIKSGGCPEDCAYCPQSLHFDTGVTATKPASRQAVEACASTAKANGATRFCMGAAWRSPKDRDIDHVAELIGAVKALDMEVCVTLGMLTRAQADRLKQAGLDYYNHNLDTSEAYYGMIISTRDYADRLATLHHVRQAGLKVCCGGIVGMGEAVRDRAALLHTLASFPEPPESVPINLLVRVAGTPLATARPLDPIDLVRTIAVARILMPRSYLRLSAGRGDLSDAEQALCFFAGANSIFYGEELLTTPNPDVAADRALLEKLGLRPAPQADAL